MNKLFFTIVFTCLSIFSVNFVTIRAEAKQKMSPFPYDAKFLDQFSEHHSGAIEMGELASLKAENPEVKKMAAKMVSDQKGEIKKMKEWREKISSAPEVASSMQKIDMGDLSQKNGREFDFAFLDMMAKHHKQGVNMAKEASFKLSNPEVKAFAKTAAVKQEQERHQLLEMKKSEASEKSTNK
ncbi:MAG: hypothetical protein B7Y39_04540 [Bdellovibrio sp. 28-41-41]|nr:MAG: hypothetical protein B7Y39_04540 [Bdellovibrio sp. 28-41-41]